MRSAQGRRGSVRVALPLPSPLRPRSPAPGRRLSVRCKPRENSGAIKSDKRPHRWTTEPWSFALICTRRRASGETKANAVPVHFAPPPCTHLHTNGRAPPPSLVAPAPIPRKVGAGKNTRKQAGVGEDLPLASLPPPSPRTGSAHEAHPTFYSPLLHIPSTLVATIFFVFAHS
ncbi:hypothetical protein EI94DRAFT_119873 [Lactarius quietus]|nr:hypothetical protein EI94DRAFT_119873 [Lactarius quietus]